MLILCLTTLSTAAGAVTYKCKNASGKLIKIQAAEPGDLDNFPVHDCEQIELISKVKDCGPGAYYKSVGGWGVCETIRPGQIASPPTIHGPYVSDWLLEEK